jgi:hypothetical protein
VLLVLQIAGGIVLGWYIISHWDKLTKAAGQLAAFALGAVAVAGMAWGVIAVGQSVWSSVDTIGYYAFCTFMFALGIAGIVGLSILLAQLFPRVFKTDDEQDEKKRGDGIFAVTIFAYMMLVFLMAGVTSFFFPGIDAWSRANGYEDTGIMFTGLLLSQWVWWPALKLVARNSAKQAAAE